MFIALGAAVACRKGIVINLVTEPETRDMAQFIRTYDYEIPEMPDDIMCHFNSAEY